MIGFQLGTDGSRIATITGTGPTVRAEGPAALPEDFAALPDPERLAGVIRELLAGAGLRGDDDARDVVATVPAWYNDEQRRAVKNAIDAAGMRCFRLINDPSAAALRATAARSTATLRYACPC